MVDSAAELSPPKIHIVRTAYDAYRLCFGAIFASRKFLRFFLYGTALSLGIGGAIKYARLAGFLYLPAGVTWNVEVNFFLETLFSIVTLAGLAAVQAPMGVATIRFVILGETPGGPYFSGASGRWRRFALLTFIVYVLFHLTSLAFVPLALVHGINPIYRGDVMAEAVQTPAFLLEILLAWAVLGLLTCWVSASWTARFATYACGDSLQISGSTAHLRAVTARLVLTYAVAMVPVAVVAIAVYYAGIASYIFGHWAAVEPQLSEMNVQPLAYNLLRSKEYLISYGIILVCGQFAHILIAACAARAYQIRVERGLSGAAEIFS